MSPIDARDLRAPAAPARLLAKYGARAWRYRAYPPAEWLASRVDAHEALDALSARGAAPVAPLSICIRGRADAAPLARWMEREIATQRGALGRDEPVAHVRWEGEAVRGLGIGHVSRIMERLRAFFDVAAGAECAFESDGGDISPEEARSLAAVGFSEAVISGRTGDAARAIAVLRAAGFRAVALDGVTAVPRAGEAGVDSVADLRPDRLSLAAGGDDPAVLARAVDRIVGAGYVHLGYDRFAAPDDPLALAWRAGQLHRGPWGYCARPAGDVLGVGPDATTAMGRVVLRNLASADDYRDRLDRGELPVACGVRLDDEARLRGDVLDALSCTGRVDFATLSTRYGVDAARRLEAEIASLDELERDGVVERTARGLATTPGGRYLLGEVCGAFERRADVAEARP